MEHILTRLELQEEHLQAMYQALQEAVAASGLCQTELDSAASNVSLSEGSRKAGDGANHFSGRSSEEYDLRFEHVNEITELVLTFAAQVYAEDAALGESVAPDEAQ